mgnify:CR=1 FL=1
MVSKKELKIFERFQFYDKYGRFPKDKVRIDITLSQEALNKLKRLNKSQVINRLILDSS